MIRITIRIRIRIRFRNRVKDLDRKDLDSTDTCAERVLGVRGVLEGIAADHTRSLVIRRGQHVIQPEHVGEHMPP